MRPKYLSTLLLCGLTGCAAEAPMPPAMVQTLGHHDLALTEVGAGAYQLLVKKDALEHATKFLFSSSSIETGIGEPSFSGRQTRVVTFKEADGKVQMLESQQGSAVDPKLVAPNLVASFPIVSESEDALGLDFNIGAETLFEAIDRVVPSSDGAQLADYEKRWNGSELTQRYIDDANTDAAGRVTIRQVARAAVDDNVETLEMRYFLQPYQPDPDYKPLVSRQDLRWTGFWATQPVLVPGTHDVERHITRFNPNRSLTYAISANTPAEIKQAVREGIQYWNQVAGFDWIDVIDAPQGVTAPSLGYNLVQWIDENNAERAYADAQVDPLTGETLNVQIYLPSMFYDGTWRHLAASVAQLPAALNTSQTAQGMQRTMPTNAPVQHAAGGCEMSSVHAGLDAARAALGNDLSDEAKKRVALDRVRSTIAHEVGHTLGLLHNFAGSLGSNVALDEVDALRREYFVSGAWPEDKTPSSSIMDYLEFEDAAALGARIRLGQPPLAYDVHAIDVLYNGAPDSSDGPLFCTDIDSRQGRFFDCRQWDGGANIVERLQRDIDLSIRDAAVTYVLHATAAKQQHQADVLAFTSPEQDAAAAYRTRLVLAALVSSESSLLESDRAIGSPSLNAARIHADSVARSEAWIESAGGIAKFFALLPDDFDATFVAKLKEVLAHHEYPNSAGPDAPTWELTHDELAKLVSFVPEYLARYHATAAVQDIRVLRLGNPVASAASDDSSDWAKWEVSSQAPELEALLAGRLAHYVQSTAGDPLRARIAMVDADGAAESRNVSLPRFAFATELRQFAALLLDPRLSDDRLWGREQRNQASAELLAQLSEGAGAALEQLMLEGSDESAQRWMLDNRDVVNTLTTQIIE